MSNNNLIILITGASTGLGRLTAKKCLQSGHIVIITGRSEQRIKEAKQWILQDSSPQHESRLHGITMDLLDVASMKKAVQVLGTLVSSIDVIVHNAGGLNPKFSQTYNFEDTVFMNAVAPLYLNQLLLPFIEKSQHPLKRIIFVASQIHNAEINDGTGELRNISEDVQLDELTGNKETWDTVKYYRLSKLALIWGVLALIPQLESTKVILMCPGYVPTTDLARHSRHLVDKDVDSPHATSQDESTDAYIYLITSPDIKSGSYYRKKELTSVSNDALNKRKQQEFYQLVQKAIQSISCQY
ncbi:uncharacterized protein B0P05DRAFT_531759 [Gilbertella persicaria]|uniref:uncharacterized protein n=1 Tax=Gilbertella persicaria TaxID=101096 RepID=UPI00221FEA03|nr:uncharacterized protein B0P05DRAFT_531759 [Gilbertella persicaria]KAI8087647.1 hypothetical protein B0P05DRAFT_531759 [Gilbertella persicaria]